jgi:hypothetical protein
VSGVVTLLIVLFVLAALVSFGVARLDTRLPLPRLMGRYRFRVSVENVFHRWSTVWFSAALIFLICATLTATSS